MGTFYANPALMAFHAGKMAEEAKDVSEVAAQLETIAQKVESMESLEKHGYARMIRQSKKELSFRVEMLEHCVEMLNKTAELYTRHENRAMATFEGKELEPDGPIITPGEKDWIDRIGEAWCGDTSGSVACSLLSGTLGVDVGIAELGVDGGLLELEGGGDAGSSYREAHARGKDELKVARGGAKARLGTKDNNAHVRVKVNAGHVDLEGEAGMSVKKGDAGGGVKGSASASIADAEIEIGGTIGGTEYNLAVMPSVGIGGYAEGQAKPESEGGDTVYGFAFGPIGVRLSKRKASN